MNRKTGCLLFSLALVALGFFLFRRAATPPKVGEDFTQLAPEVKAEHRQSAQQLQSNVENLVTSSRNNENKRFTLVATEAQLNTLLQDNLRIKNFPISDLRLGLTPGELAMQGKVNYKGFNGVVTARGDATVENSKLKFNLKQLQIGILPAPKAVKEKTEKAITDVLNKNLAKTPGTIDRVEIADKTLTIEGTTN